MDKLEDKILQHIISGGAAGDRGIAKEISNDPSFDKSDFDLLNKIWNEADNLKTYKRVQHADAWQSIVDEAGIKPEIKRINWATQWAMAASVVALLSYGVYFYLNADPYVTYVAATDESLTLPDNSVVDLKKGAEVRYLNEDVFNEAASREIYLTGEGIFDIKPDTKPFRVITQLTSVDVLGTKFKYIGVGEFSESENMEGQVRFATNDGKSEQVLNPGDKASFDGKEMVVDLYVPPPPPAPVIPTNNVSLADLIDILGDRYPLRLLWAPSVKYTNTVIKINLAEVNLDSIISNLQEDPMITIEASKSGQGYKISSLSAEPSGLTADYNYLKYSNGVRPNQ